MDKDEYFTYIGKIAYKINSQFLKIEETCENKHILANTHTHTQN